MIVRLLINHGADLHMKTISFGLAPIHLACKSLQMSTAILLIHLGANIYDNDAHGLTSLDYIPLNEFKKLLLQSTLDSSYWRKHRNTLLLLCGWANVNSIASYNISIFRALDVKGNRDTSKHIVRVARAIISYLY